MEKWKHYWTLHVTSELASQWLFSCNLSLKFATFVCNFMFACVMPKYPGVIVREHARFCPSVWFECYISTLIWLLILTRFDDIFCAWYIHNVLILKYISVEYLGPSDLTKRWGLWLRRWRVGWLYSAKMINNGFIITKRNNFMIF